MRNLAALIVLALAGCATTSGPPQVVTRTVEVFKPLPAWATETLPNDRPASGRVGDIVSTNNRRAEWLDYANCRSRLLRQLDDGNEVDPKACKKP